MLTHYLFVGGLQKPTLGLVEICSTTEKGIRNVLESTDNKIPAEENFLNKFCIIMAQKFYNQGNILFPNLQQHFLNCSELYDESHYVKLLKEIIKAYCKIRFYNLAKKYTSKIQGLSVRRHLNKLILFNHQ